MLLVEKANELIEEKNIGLIVVDSLTSHFRSDFVGRSELAPRQQKLNKLRMLVKGANNALGLIDLRRHRPGR